MNLLSWIVLGLLAGIVANLLDPNPRDEGRIGITILGILGAVVGGFLGSFIPDRRISEFDWPSLGLAVLGALILLFIRRVWRRRTI